MMKMADNKMISVELKFWTDGLPEGSCWSSGLFYMPANTRHSVKPQGPKPFNSIEEISERICDIIEAHGITLNASRGQTRRINKTEGGAILHEDQYLEFIRARGVGAKDRVASSPKSYVSYLRSVSGLLEKDITPALLRSEQDIDNIMSRIGNQRAPSTLRNYRSAMRQYVNLVSGKSL